MSITAKIYIEHELLALIPTVQRLGDISIRVITQGNTNPGSTEFPFFIEYADRDELEVALGADPTIESYKCVDWTGTGGIYYIEHSEQTELISTVATEVNGFLIHTETRDGGWLVRLLLPNREALSEIWEYARGNDISMEILEIYGNSNTNDETSYGLTEEQRIALKTVYEHGYFNEPRDISLDEAADKIGLSSTAMSGRLRRGMRNLISSTIADADR